MRIKALLALLGLGLALMLVVGCDDDNDDDGPFVRGTITNASTGQPQGNATVTLLQNGTAVATAQASNSGTFSFSDVDPGSGYTLQVVSNATTAEFPPFTSNAFTVPSSGTTTQNITVGSGILGALSGTVTNASTGLGQGNATVTLLQGELVIATAQTDPQGQFSFADVAPGTGYTLLVTSNADPAEFVDVTSTTFTVAAGANTQNVTVGSGVGGTTVSGVIGTIESTATFAISILQGTQTIATTTAGPAEEPAFTLTNVPPGSGYVIKVVSSLSGITTLFGPVTVPEGGRSNLTIFPRTEDQLEQEGVPSNASVVAYIAGGGTITANNVVSTFGNPTWLANLPAGNTNVTVTPGAGTPFTFNVPVSTTLPVVIRFNTTN